ncbi:MAG TPA: alpha/beta hydrolase [Methylomirabilota bacterium]
MADLAYQRSGEGPRAVVLLHGFLGSGRNLTSLARALSERHADVSVFALDLTGHGSSPPLPVGADLGTLAADVLATARRVAGGARMIVVGHSLGGRVALRAALLEPTAIAHVTLLDISPSPLPPGGETVRVVEALLAAPDTASDRNAFRAHFAAAGLPAALTEWLLLNLAHEGDGYRWRIDRAALARLQERTGREDVWAAVERERTYTVKCVRGGRSPYVSEPDARRLSTAGCLVVTIPGAGHFLHTDRPADVVAAVATDLG